MRRMKIVCPHCSQNIEIERSHAGMTAPCPTCLQQFQCPPISAFPAPKGPTPKQAALLAYLGIGAPETKDEASSLITSAIESGHYSEQLERWQDDRIRLHPEIYKKERAARNAERAECLQYYVNNDVGSSFHPLKRITRAQAQAAVNYLDATSPGWDADLWGEFGIEDAVAFEIFVPAVAATSPNAVKKGFRGQYSLYPLPPPLPRGRPSEQPRRRPVQRPAKQSKRMGCILWIVIAIALAVAASNMNGL